LNSSIAPPFIIPSIAGGRTCDNALREAVRGGISRVGGKKCEEKVDQIDGDQEEAAGEERFPQGYCSCFLAPEVGDGADEDGGEIQGAPNEA